VWGKAGALVPLGPRPLAFSARRFAGSPGTLLAPLHCVVVVGGDTGAVPGAVLVEAQGPVTVCAPPSQSVQPRTPIR
jgi:hypothetical protein